MMEWVQSLKWRIGLHRLKRALCVGVALIIINVLLHAGKLPRSYDYIEENNIKFNLPLPPTSSHKQQCTFKGQKVNIQSVLGEIKSKNFSSVDSYLKTMWEKKNCSPYKVAIIVPYRNREEQLKTFLQYMHWFLQKQLLDYHIYVVEQSDKMDFNRALLFNIGYVEASKRDEIPCFIFHDVDLLPENTDNIYVCTSCPRHMSACVNTLRYTLVYKNLFGGAVAILSQQFELVNGFSNKYFGWGGEDDDMYERVTYKNLDICRFSPSLSRYTMLHHRPSIPSANRYDLLKRAIVDQEQDGLNVVATKYKLLKSENGSRHTILHVEAL